MDTNQLLRATDLSRALGARPNSRRPPCDRTIRRWMNVGIDGLRLMHEWDGVFQVSSIAWVENFLRAVGEKRKALKDRQHAAIRRAIKSGR